MDKYRVNVNLKNFVIIYNVLGYSSVLVHSPVQSNTVKYSVAKSTTLYYSALVYSRNVLESTVQYITIYSTMYYSIL